MSKHTPGPWVFEPVSKYPFGVAVKSADGEVIFAQSAICWASDQKTREDNERGVGFKPYKRNGDGTTADEAAEAIATQDANARLIAAAPELLEAARTFQEYCEAIDDGDDVAAMHFFAIAQQQFKAVIAKAEGRT